MWQHLQLNLYSFCVCISADSLSSVMF